MLLTGNLGCINHVAQGSNGFFESTSFETAIRINPEQFRIQYTQGTFDHACHFIHTWNTWAMDIIYAKSNAQFIRVQLKAVNEFTVTAGRLDRNNIGIHRFDGIIHVMEFSIAYMCVNLSRVLNRASGNTESFDIGENYIYLPYLICITEKLLHIRLVQDRSTRLFPRC